MEIDGLGHRIFFFFYHFFNFAFGCAGSLSLRGLSSGCSGRGLLFTTSHRFPMAAASLVAEHRLQGTELQ